MKNPEKNIVEQLNINSLRNEFDLLRSLIQNRVDIFMTQNLIIRFLLPNCKSLGTLLLKDFIEADMVAEVQST